MRQILVFFLFFSIHTFGQESIDVHRTFSQATTNYINLGHKASYFSDFTDTLSISEVLLKSFRQEAFHYYKPVESQTCWVKFTLQNTDIENAYPLAFIFSSYDDVRVFEKSPEGLYERIMPSDFKQFYSFSLKSKATKDFIVRLHKNDQKIGRIYLKCWYWGNTYRILGSIQNNFAEEIIQSHTLAILFNGFFLTLFLYHLMIFIQTQKMVYLYYCLYVLSLLIYFYPKNPYYLYLFALEDTFSMRYHFYNVLIQPFIYFWYFNFLRSFVEKEKNYQNIKRFLHYLSMFCLITISLLIVEYQYQWTGYFYTIYNVFRILVIIICMTLISYFIKNYTPVIKYILIGASFFLIGALLAFGLSGKEMIFGSKITAILFMKIGSVIEILLFALGLGARIKLIEQQKQDTQTRLINELQKNEKLQTALEQKLQQEISIIKYEKEIALLESRLLRSRMNPHFIFNSMNALKRFVLENKQVSAADYLDQFSILLRQVLINSGKRMISLQEELDALHNYLELERNRLEDGFDYHIEIDPNVDTYFTQIPPMLLQPFVENSIWHGIRHLKNIKGKISISIQEENEMICITIEDNGIGRIKATEINQQNRTEHESIASTLTNQRLSILKSYENLIIDIEITDKPNHTGTLVRIVMAE